MAAAGRTAIVIGLAVFTAYVATLAPDLSPRALHESNPAFQVTDPAALQALLSRRGSVDGLSPAAILERGWASLPGAPGLNGLAAALAAAAAALLASLITAHAGALAGLAAGLAFALSPIVWAMGVAPEGSVNALVLIGTGLATLVTWRCWSASGHRAWLVAALIALVLASAEDVSAGIALTLFLMASRCARGRTMAIAVGCAGALLLGIAWQVIDITTPEVSPPIGRVEGIAETLTALWRWGSTPGLPVSDALMRRADWLWRGIGDQVGVLGWVLAVLGIRSISMLAAVVLMAAAIVAGPVPGPWELGARTAVALAGVWGAIGLGTARFASWGPSGRRVALAVCLALPLLQAGRTIAAADHLVNRPAGDMLQALVTHLTSPATIVAEDARSARLMRWAAGRRATSSPFDVAPQDAERLAGLARSRTTMLATDAAATRLSLSGFGGPSFVVGGRPLEDLLRRVDKRALVTATATPGALDGHDGARHAIADLDKRPDRSLLPRESAFVLLARPWERQAHLVTDQARADLLAGPHGDPAVPASVRPAEETRLTADRTGAVLSAADLEIARIDRGLILGWWSPLDGHLEWAGFDPQAGLTTSWRLDRWSFSRLDRAAACIPLDDTAWSDVTDPSRAARVGIQLPAGSRLRLYLARDRGLFVRAATFPDRLPVDSRVVTWDLTDADRAREARAALQSDGVGWPEGPRTPRFVWQVSLASSPFEPALVALGLGGPPDWARARGAGGEDSPARVCPGVAGTRLFERDGQREVSISAADAESFADGWGPVVRSGQERWRETSGSQSDLLVRVDALQAATLTVSARPVSSTVAGTVSLIVNGTTVGDRRLQPGQRDYTWDIPRERWVAGTNQLTLHTLPDQSPATDATTPHLLVTMVKLRR